MPAWKCERLISGHYRLLGWLGISQLGWSRLAYHQSTSPGELSYFASQHSSMSDSSIFTTTLFHAWWEIFGQSRYPPFLESELVLCISWIEWEKTWVETCLEPNELSTRLKFGELEFNLFWHTMILHSQINPDCPQIAPDHPRTFPNYAFGTIL